MSQVKNKKGGRGQSKYRKRNRYVPHSSYSNFNYIKELTRSERTRLSILNIKTTKGMDKATFGGNIFGNLRQSTVGASKG